MAAEPDGGTPALTKVRDFLISTCGSVLKAWLAQFDVDLDYRVSKIEFADGMRNLGYTAGELHKLFAEIDADGSGEIVLDELDEEQAMLWNTFRSWAVQNFVSVEDMMLSLTEDEGTMNLSTKDLECISQENFCKRLPELNWKAGQEELLFSVLDFDGDGLLRPSCFRWLGIELKRLQRKRAAKASAVKKKPSGLQQNALEQELHEFKEDLRRRFGGGNLTRAWRLSLSDTSVLPRTRFLKACAKMGYAKKGKDLWKMMDKTGSGFASVDEIDPRTAQVVAHFKKFLDERFDDYHAAFEELDLDGTRKIRLRQFQQGLQKLGFPFHAQAATLFAVLDLDCNHVIDEDDLHFLEKWSPLPFLTATPNLNAKDGVKKLLLHRYHRPVKVWRQLLDRDGSNRCNWHEFLFACKTCGFHGDIPGAWRALDADLTGYITLKELDEDSYNTLMEFRTWALDEFGSAKGAFSVFDRDGSNTLTFQEFRAACKIYGYEGHAKKLFSALDVTAEGTLSLKEVAFLDDWREDPEAVKKARNAIAGFLLSPISPGSEAARRGGMVAGFQNVKEMQRKLLDMERAKEAAMQWHSPVAKPMELVDLCRRYPVLILSKTMKGTAVLQCWCRKHAMPSEDAGSSPSPPPPSPRWSVRAGAVPRLEGPDFCRQFFVRQAEVRSQEVRLPDRRVLYSKATGKVPAHLPAIALPQDAAPKEAHAQDIQEEPKETHNFAEAEEVVEKMEHLPQPLLKPTLDELLRTPRSFSGLLSSMPWQGKCVKPVGKANKLRALPKVRKSGAPGIVLGEMDSDSGWRKALFLAGGTVAAAGLLWYLFHDGEEEASASSTDVLFYRVTDPKGASIGIREEPDVKSTRTGKQLLPHQVFQVSEVREDGEQTYLRLADGRGWAFTHSSKDGRLLCEKISQEEAIQELEQSQPTSREMMAQMLYLMETQPVWRLDFCRLGASDVSILPPA
eukprot:s5811_g6.t2